MDLALVDLGVTMKKDVAVVVDTEVAGVAAEEAVVDEEEVDTENLIEVVEVIKGRYILNTLVANVIIIEN